MANKNVPRYHQGPLSSVQSLCHSQLFATPWTAARQDSLSFTNSQSMLKLMSIESVCHPIISSSVVPLSSCLPSFPALGSFLMSQLFASGGQSIGASASALVIPMNIQDLFPLGLTCFNLLGVQGTLKSLLQHHGSKASILWCSAPVGRGAWWATVHGVTKSRTRLSNFTHSLTQLSL